MLLSTKRRRIDFVGTGPALKGWLEMKKIHRMFVEVGMTVFGLEGREYKVVKVTHYKYKTKIKVHTGEWAELPYASRIEVAE